MALQFSRVGPATGELELWSASEHGFSFVGAKVRAQGAPGGCPEGNPGRRPRRGRGVVAPHGRLRRARPTVPDH
jgi:hypothetical protein